MPQSHFYSTEHVHARKVKLFKGGQGKGTLAEEIVRSYAQLQDTPIALGKADARQFSDGELSYSFEESIRGHDVFLIQSTPPPSDTIMELLLMIDAAKRASAHYVTAVVPYFGYARQDRKDKPRVCIAAKLFANLLSSAGANRIMTMDLHAGQIQGFFDIPVDHLDSTAIFFPYLKKLQLDQLIFVAPDVGSVARARIYAKYFGAELAVCDKQRARANQISNLQVIGKVEGKHVVIVDDLVDTAGTLCTAAKALMEEGAKSVRVICTHALLSGDAYEKIHASPITQLTVTNSLPLQKPHKKIHVLSVGDLFAKAIYSIHTNSSISSLFVN